MAASLFELGTYTIHLGKQTVKKMIKKHRNMTSMQMVEKLGNDIMNLEKIGEKSKKKLLDMIEKNITYETGDLIKS